MSGPDPSARPVAFVTGGGSGIGRAAAVALAQQGAAVVVADADGQLAAEVAAVIAEDGGRALATKVDVSRESEVQASLDATISEFGKLDSAVNCAGIQGDLAAVEDCTFENWQRTLAVNLSGVFLCLREEVRRMLACGRGGSIVNIGSNFGLVGREGMAPYCASKHGLIGLTKSVALDCAKHNIRVNAVCPGPTRTPMVEKVLAESPERADELIAAATAMVPLGRMGEAPEVAAAISWLCSDAASFVTGVALPVDGGFVAQ